MGRVAAETVVAKMGTEWRNALEMAIVRPVRCKGIGGGGS